MELGYGPAPKLATPASDPCFPSLPFVSSRDNDVARYGNTLLSIKAVFWNTGVNHLRPYPHSSHRGGAVAREGAWRPHAAAS